MPILSMLFTWALEEQNAEDKATCVSAATYFPRADSDGSMSSTVNSTSPTTFARESNDVRYWIGVVTSHVCSVAGSTKGVDDVQADGEWADVA